MRLFPQLRYAGYGQFLLQLRFGYAFREDCAGFTRQQEEAVVTERAVDGLGIQPYAPRESLGGKRYRAVVALLNNLCANGRRREPEELGGGEQLAVFG